MSSDSGPSNRAFLLRWWQEDSVSPHEQSAWRFSLEEIGRQPRRRYGFSSLADLAAFLEKVLRGDSDESPPLDDTAG